LKQLGVLGSQIVKQFVEDYVEIINILLAYCMDSLGVLSQLYSHADSILGSPSSDCEIAASASLEAEGAAALTDCCQ